MSESRSIFEGVGVAVVTPYRKGAVDAEALGRLAEHLVRAASTRSTPAAAPARRLA